MRELTKEERRFIRYLVNQNFGYEYLVNQLFSANVEAMDDGRMGSLRFGGLRRVGESLNEYQFTDTDGVLVLATIFLDDDGNLYELDMWKTDFSPLKEIPNPS